ncbi:MAG: flavodoxin family protein [Oscillospiraceae bacterium]|nr:flavodoxin family protein [Oscillospiraceae bacterium]
MKIIAIAGSLRDGNSVRMVEFARESIKEVAEVEILHLKNIQYSFCNGCLECDDLGKCVLSDDMDKIIPRIAECDGLILCTPARWGLLSGELKTFLDRLNPLATQETLSGKKAIVFSVGQSEKNSDDAESIELACESLKTFCENSDIDVVDSVCVYECLLNNDVMNFEDAVIECQKAAKLLVEELKSNE